MPKFRIQVIINKPVELVYQGYINPDNMLHWTKDLEKFEVIKGKPMEIGSIALLHFNKNGRTHIMEDKLEFIEAEKKIVSCVAGGGLKARVQTNFVRLAKNTVLTLIWNGKGNNLIVRFVLIILRGKIRKQALSELNEFKLLVEKFGTVF
ncbi:SRPBCC family protein [Draconibacterium sp.]|nr:SRPBCC family protein [Draconibacterium sp.]